MAMPLATTRARSTLVVVGLACACSASTPSDPGGSSGGSGAVVTSGGNSGQAGSLAGSAPGAGTGSSAAGASFAGSSGAASTAGSGSSTEAGAGGTAIGGSGAGTSGSAGAAGSADGPKKSGGCDKAPTIQGGADNPITIQSNGARKYLLRVPDDYDSAHPYRLVIAFHESGASAKAVWDYGFYKLWDLAQGSTIFVAPEGLNAGWSNSGGNDVTFTDAILKQIEADRCIDTSRIFATGFSFGGAMSIALACARADVFRGVAFFSGANLSGCQGGTMPIAYYASQASQDHGSLPADSPIAGEVMQAKFAAVNGCTAQETPIPATGSGKPHVCTKYQGCSPGHPVEYCGFDGQHGWQPLDPGQATSWDPPEAWRFITQF